MRAGGATPATLGRAPLAGLLALALWLGAGLAPAAAPGLPLPAALVPAPVLAADDIDVLTAARYTVDPAHRRIRAVVDVEATNTKPDALNPGGVTRFYYDGVNLGLHPEARNVRATEDGASARVTVAKRKGYRLATVLFARRLYYGQTARVRVAFDLPGGAPRSASDIRVGAAFATFTAWAFGDRGTVRIDVPSGFTVDIGGEAMTERPGHDGLQTWTATTRDPAGWYAWLTATNDEGLARDRVTLPGGKDVLVRGWPEDRKWRSRVKALLRDGVPELVSRIGLPWPVDGSLRVTEVHTPLLEGYSGFYDPATDTIRVSEDLDDLTIVHEASHAWFNKALFTERWITEGLADEYASRVLRALGRKRPGPAAVNGTEKAAFPLGDWPPPAAISDPAAAARERYGYNASWTVMRGIVKLVGEGGMRRAFAAAAAGTTAYPGEGTPGRSSLPNDWRRFLDLVENELPADAGTGVADLVDRFVLNDATRPLLAPRAAARSAYAALVARGEGWVAPAVVRAAMDGWRFPEATEAMASADRVLATRDAVAALAAQQGLVPDASARAAYQDASDAAALDALAGRERASLDALRAIGAAATAVAAPRDWFADMGLAGSDPAADLAAAKAAWTRGDAPAAQAGAEAVSAAVGSAEETGRTKVAIVGLGSVGGLVLLVLALVLVSRARSRGRGRRGGPPGRVAAGAGAGVGAGAPGLTGDASPFDGRPGDAEPERIWYPVGEPAWPAPAAGEAGPPGAGDAGVAGVADGDDVARRYPYRSPGASAADLLGRAAPGRWDDDLDA